MPETSKTWDDGLGLDVDGCDVSADMIAPASGGSSSRATTARSRRRGTQSLSSSSRRNG